jgi:hypothetical protein
MRQKPLLRANSPSLAGRYGVSSTPAACQLVGLLPTNFREIVRQRTLIIKLRTLSLELDSLDGNGNEEKAPLICARRTDQGYLRISRNWAE